MNLYLGDKDPSMKVYEKLNDRWEIAVCMSEGQFQQALSQTIPLRTSCAGPMRLPECLLYAGRFLPFLRFLSEFLSGRGNRRRRFSGVERASRLWGRRCRS